MLVCEVIEMGLNKIMGSQCQRSEVEMRESL